MRNLVLLAALALPALVLPAFGQYSYYYSDNFQYGINGSNWQSNGSWSNSTSPLYSGASAGASLISKIPVPDGTAAYEVRTQVKLDSTGGTYVHYIHATQDAMTGPSPSGTFYSIEWGNVVLGNGCQMTMTVNQRVNGVFTQRSSSVVGCQQGALNTMQTVVIDNGALTVYLNGMLVYGTEGANVIPGGQPGVGVINAPAGNGFTLVQMGLLDRTGPGAVDRGRVATTTLPNSVEIQWQSADDGQYGSGVPHYWLRRDGVVIALIRSNYFLDQTVQPGQTYSYTISPVDRHSNDGPSTTFSVTTPTQAGEARRVGVRPDGAYWGGAGEQIDMMSGNLNFSVPLLAATRRGGWTLPLGLSYNSQNWRRDNGQAEWNLGRDIGYGYGWMLMAGQIRPHYTDTWNIHHWTYVDSTGAEYRLDQYSGGKWRSKEPVYVVWDDAMHRLLFPDGSYWNFYCVSGAGEADRGTYYPTAFVDRNGNLTGIEYNPGFVVGLPDTSGRIGKIFDVRAGGSWNAAYQFYYGSGPTPHLSQITNAVNTAEQYTFGYGSETTLQSPFTGAAFGTAVMLTTITNPGVNLSHNFTYGASNSGELTKVVLPKGAEMEWAYDNADYSNGKRFREVKYRYLRTSSGAPTWSYTLAGYDAGSGVTVSGRSVTDPNNHARAWFFYRDPAQSNFRRLFRYEDWRLSTGTVVMREDFTWATDALGRLYLGTTETVLDYGAAYEKRSKVEQVLDSSGGVTERRIYEYGSLSTPARIYRNYYTDIAGAHLATTSEVQEGTQTTVLGEWWYDTPGYYGQTGWLVDAPYMNYHAAGYGPANYTRGMVTRSKALGKPMGTVVYDIGGNVVQAAAQGGATEQFTVTSASQWTAPSSMVPNGENNLGSSFQFDSVLRLSSAAGPNGASSTYQYDAVSRPSSTTSALGAVTTYSYTATTATATTNGHFAKTTTDGLGRTVKVEKGAGSTVVSVVDTEYGPCACSPLGKVKKVSMPYAPGATVYWTEYLYDERGRTIRVTPPGNAGYTQYIYEGNTVKVIEPVTTKWKKFTLDARGRLVTVTEPRPGVSGASD
ncbi:MAG: hypothetical protein HY821_16255, partial [Acidobacteria bacterium]|nr:hypothetical protein [Acidobacteriota bacterium]